MSFIYLNNKSEYTFLSSSLRIKDIVKKGIDNKMPFLALTDVNNMFGLIEFINECKKNNIKPIAGMEVRLNNLSSSPLILLASSDEGYRSLCKLTSLVSKGKLDYSVSLEELALFKEGIICIVPYLRSRFEEMEYASRVSFIKEINNIYKGLYLGLEYYTDRDYEALENARRLAANENLRTVPVFDVYCEKKDDIEIVDVLRAIKQVTKVDALEYINHENHYFLSELRLKQIFTEKEIFSTQQLAALCDVDFDKFKGSLIKYPLKEGVDSFGYLQALCNAGLIKRLNGKVIKKYTDRLNFELKIINDMGFTDYFLVVYDYVKFAKKSGIRVGPGRGSAGGCLVAYTLGITNIDPIKYDLLFERFLNPERVTMPDIDIDFLDSRRGEIFDYLIEKYGSDRVCRVISFQTFKTRSCIRDVFKAMGCSISEVDSISSLLTRGKNDIDMPIKEVVDMSPGFKSKIKTNERYAHMYEVALRLEGFPRQTSMHAAGVIVNNDSLTNNIPVYSPDGSNVITTQFDLTYIESLSFLKMDILSLTNLTVIDECVKLIEEKYGKKLDINNIDLDDPNIYENIKKCNTAGIFQMDEPGMKRAVSVIKPSNFEEVSAVLALGRPGPNKYIQTYNRRKNGLLTVKYDHPLTEPITKSTYGIMVYQEQVIQVLTTLAGFSMGKADLVRRAISKKNEEKIKLYEQDFIKGCIKNKISEFDAKKIYENIKEFANYGFNKSHSVAYAIISSQLSYIKYYYPEIFYSCTLNVFGSKKKVLTTLQEMKNNGVNVGLPLINEANINFLFKDNKVILGFNEIKDLDSKLIIALLAERRSGGRFKDYFDAVVRLKAVGFNESSLIELIEAGCFDCFEYSRATMISNIKKVMLYGDIVSTVIDGKVFIDYSMTNKPIIIEETESKIETLEKERNRLGLYISAHPLAEHREKIAKAGFVRTVDVVESKKKYKVVVCVEKSKPTKTRNGDQMCYFTANDESGNIEITVFPTQYMMYSSLIKPGKYLQVLGKADERNDEIQLVVDMIKEYPLVGKE